MVSPRVGIIVKDLALAGPLNMRLSAGYARYYNPYDLSLGAEMALPAWQYELYAYDPDSTDADDEGYSVRELKSDFYRPDVDPQLKPEYTDEVTLGWDTSSLYGQFIGLTAIYRRSGDLIETVGDWKSSDGTHHLATDVDTSDSLAMQQWYDSWDGTTCYVTNPSGAFREYTALDLHWFGGFLDSIIKWQMSLTWSKTRGTLENTSVNDDSYTHASAYYDTPALSEGLDGSLHWNSPFVAKMSTIFDFPFDFSLGMKAHFHRGYSYNRISIDTNPGGDPIDSVLPEGRGTYRLPDVFLLDLSLQKDFRLHEIGYKNKWGILTCIVDISNVFNNQVALAREEHTGSNFGRDISWSSPRTVRFQLCYSF